MTQASPVADALPAWRARPHAARAHLAQRLVFRSCPSPARDDRHLVSRMALRRPRRRLGRPRRVPDLRHRRSEHPAAARRIGHPRLSTPTPAAIAAPAWYCRIAAGWRPRCVDLPLSRLDLWVERRALAKPPMPWPVLASTKASKGFSPSRSRTGADSSSSIWQRIPCPSRSGPEEQGSASRRAPSHGGRSKNWV